MKYKIVIKDQLTLEQIKDEIERGGRFLVFPYTISLIFAVTLNRMSPAIFVKKEDSISGLTSKYKWISRIFGWWCIPWGPMYTMQSLRVNRKGGINVTEDIMLNISEESLTTREIELKSVALRYIKPSKFEIKAFNKVINKFEAREKIEKMVVGKLINEETDDGNTLVIGISFSDEFLHYTDIFEKALYTQFYKHVRFRFLDVSYETEAIRALLKQGEVIL